MKKRVLVLGSTGSIGTSALKVAEQIPERMEIVGLAAGQSVAALAQQAKRWGVDHLFISNEQLQQKLQKLVPATSEIFSGERGLVELVEASEPDLVLVAIVGVEGLAPALRAIEVGCDLAVASKEILVMAGEVIMEKAQQKGVKILPVDSEHNAIFQCLEGHQKKERPVSEVRRLILTASGGPFRTWKKADLQRVSVDQALRHPTWIMGRKITIDSATLFNKGLEMIEARWLFGLPMKKVEVIVHPQSIVHSMVEFIDGSVLAQLSATDMCFPIQYAVTYPERITSGLKPLNFSDLAKLEFEAPRDKDFPALRLAREAGERGGSLPAVLNASNEVAVAAFLEKTITFLQIAEVVEETMLSIPHEQSQELNTVLKADKRARDYAHKLLSQKRIKKTAV